MSVTPIRRSKERLEGLRHRQTELVRECERIQADQVRIAEAMQAEGLTEFKTKSLQRQLSGLQDAADRNRHEREAIALQLKAAAGRLGEAKRQAPARAKQLTQLEAVLREAAADAMAIEQDLSSVLARMSRMQPYRQKIRKLRSDLGLPAAEPWLCFETRSAEVVIANIWAWFSANGAPASIKMPDAPRKTLRELFSESSWRAYMPPDDDDSLPPQAA